ncbi:SH3-like domain-containing protein [Sphingobium sp. B1D7B]|uniref:SH3 domain-containing protein n=1 Tax=unclassified Sphingobium TaxID=2611147 RepID=UPI0022247C95|nr:MULTISPECIES: SH3 domain-containing protein [unclassified Sphingobium]MCW2391716.1 SH3-like domain-containing protein [Sphingobium sp. B11D3A]MCW2403471.1 SH3-like domain-containing protein [Sphingobium sp. B1D7B]
MNARGLFTAFAALALGLGLGLGAADAQAQTGRPTPYWASLSKGEAKMRVGPSADYPASWIYRQRDLPVKVVEVYTNWRKIEDPDGTQGWMHVRLLKDEATAIVKDGIAQMRDGPSESARLLFRLAPGVVGRLSGCSDGWCAMEVNGRRGYVQAASLWGALD